MIGLVVIAITLMLLDAHSKKFHAIRQHVSVVAYPVQLAVSEPIKWAHQLNESMTRQRQLLEENADLRAHQLMLESKLQKLMAIEHENAQLRELLQSSAHISGKSKAAQLLAIDLNPAVQQIILDKGKRDHVYPGQPVFDAYGVIGQVVDVGPLTSKVMLLTDSRFAISVKDQRNGFRAIASGMGSNQHVELLHISDNEFIQVGDQFVTSGLGLHFPVGYPVGIVSAVERVPGERFLRVSLTPSAHFNQTQQVVLIWPEKAVLTKEVQDELEKPIPIVTN